MAVIEYDEYKQKLQALEPTLQELEKALSIPKAREELAQLQKETEQEGFWSDVDRSQKVSQQIKRLESKGWLTRTVSHEDERQKCISLTEAGRQLQQEVRECCLADSLRNQVDLADAELAQLKQLCDRVAAQLGR